MITCRTCPQTVYAHRTRNGDITHDTLCYYHAKLRDIPTMLDGNETFARKAATKQAVLPRGPRLAVA